MADKPSVKDIVGQGMADVPVIDIMDKNIVLKGTETVHSNKYGIGMLLYVNVDGDDLVAITWSQVLIDQAERLAPYIPIECRITRSGRAYVFTDPV